ncbi:hypothetical protein Pcinc_016935 [Petrolisthes cinctipes]|uniref:Immunoglobulin I-set domain-containing protein n=1 Tax=Petrolisthes cinctipes TaxID=88211 RepID=A0AAE1FR69_PETCI|nr:hypothetical protein Pcinc_016935 [Petrolisthes cinctipes]
MKLNQINVHNYFAMHFSLLSYTKGKEVQHNVSGGVILSNQSLVLQSVTRGASGKYHCIASNIEGDGQSNKVTVEIKCKSLMTVSIISQVRNELKHLS